MVTHVQARPFPAADPRQSPGRLTRFGRALWLVLETIGARRARRELVRLAASCEHTNPELAAQLRSVLREDWLTRG